MKYTVDIKVDTTCEIEARSAIEAKDFARYYFDTEELTITVKPPAQKTYKVEVADIVVYEITAKDEGSACNLAKLWYSQRSPQIQIMEVE